MSQNIESTRNCLEVLSREENSVPVKSPAPPMLPRTEAPPANVHIDEFLVCSGQGEVLYDWQCKHIDSRIKLLHYVNEKASALSQLLPLGHFDRLQAADSQGRAVIVMAPDRKLFLRSHAVAPNTVATNLEA